MGAVQSLIENHKDKLIFVTGIAVTAGTVYYLTKPKQSSAIKNAEDSEDEIDVERKVTERPEKRNKDLYENAMDSEDEPLTLMRSINIVKDDEGVILEEPLIQIFDKRNTIRGIRKKQREFRVKRRACFENQDEYNRLVLFYHY